MADDTHRSITLHRLAEGVYLARNPRGGEVQFGTAADKEFGAVELLLAAIAGCSAADVDLVTGRRAEPEAFTLRVDAEKVRDNGGNILRDIKLTFHVTFPPGADGDRARAALPRAVAISHDRSCTVTRTIEHGTPIAVAIEP
jgi:putative redox protein